MRATCVFSYLYFLAASRTDNAQRVAARGMTARSSSMLPGAEFRTNAGRKERIFRKRGIRRG